LTNYLASLLAVTFFAGACGAAEPAPKSVATRYVQAPGSGTLKFNFVQAGAESHGSFRQFSTELGWDAANPTAGSLKVIVQVVSLDTQDKDRDDALRGADLFDVKAHPTAQYVANGFARRADGGLEAVGKLTLRGVTRDIRLPVGIRPHAGGVELTGEVTIRRLDFGVGQGEWKSTEWVGNDVKLHYAVPLVASR
jgi:polyisoprenoid-binding protein YceI